MPPNTHVTRWMRAMSTMPATSPKPASMSIPQVPNYINGKFQPSSTTNYMPVISPSTGATTSLTPQNSTHDEIHTAVSSASSAFQTWSTTPLPRRLQYLFQLRQAILDHMSPLQEIIRTELGKTPLDARGDIIRGLEVVEFACGAAQQMAGKALPNFGTGNLDAMQFREPLGVVANICPFNFPAMIPLWMFPLAIACGNTVVLKPSELVPGAMNVLAQICHDIKLPPGVLNVVQGGKETVETLIQHKDVKALSFVGSTPVGTDIYLNATRNGKRAQCNLGAKNHAVVMPDCDPELATNSIVGAAFGASGQRCMALSVAILVGDTKNVILDSLISKAKQIKVGMGEDADMGPIVTKKSKLRIENILNHVEKQGGVLALNGMKNDQLKSLPVGGNWMGPTIVSKVQPNMQVYQEEVFGPVLSVMSVDTLEDAIQIINANPYGNGTAIFTSSGSHARYFQHHVDAGQVGINVPIPLGPPSLSFTGSRGSILGDLPFYGQYGVDFLTRPKNVISRWPDLKSTPNTSKISMVIPSTSG